MNTFIDILVKSSANPEKTSATLIGILTTYASFIVSGLALLNISVTYDVVIHNISFVGMLVGSMLSIFGICRKMYYSFKS